MSNIKRLLPEDHTIPLVDDVSPAEQEYDRQQAEQLYEARKAIQGLLWEVRDVRLGLRVTYLGRKPSASRGALALEHEYSFGGLTLQVDPDNVLVTSATVIEDEDLDLSQEKVF